VRYWESVGRAGLWNELRCTLTDERKERFRLSEISPEDAIRSSVSTLTARFPEEMAHCRTVTALALQIYEILHLFTRWIHTNDSYSNAPVPSMISV
jgi:hypothetical protein